MSISISISDFTGLSPWWALVPFLLLGLIGLALDYRADRRRANRYKQKRSTPHEK